MAFTYNDPVIFMEYAIDVADACRERGLSTVAVTAGYICPEPRAEFYAHMDAANVDLKGFTERFYRRDLRRPISQPVSTRCVYLKHETDVWFEITNLLIPGWNDSEAEIDAMTRWIVDELGPDVPVHFTAFHPDFKMLDTPPTPRGTLRRAREIALANGVRYAYTGNARRPRRPEHVLPSLRRPPHRARLVPARTMGTDRRTADALRAASHWPASSAGLPGRWGARRLPVVLSARAE